MSLVETPLGSPYAEQTSVAQNPNPSAPKRKAVSRKFKTPGFIKYLSCKTIAFYKLVTLKPSLTATVSHHAVYAACGTMAYTSLVLNGLACAIWPKLMLPVGLLIGLGVMAVCMITMRYMLVRWLAPLDYHVSVIAKFVDKKIDTPVRAYPAADIFGRNAAQLEALRQELLVLADMRELALLEKESWQDRQDRIDLIIGEFRNMVADTLNEVSNKSDMMTKTAGLIAKLANENAGSSEIITRGSSQIYQDITTIDASAQTIAVLVQEIEQESKLANETIGATTDAAKETCENLDFLSRRVNEIGEIIGLVQEIVGQISLLSLNATIEAARAGEAGKGFAIVAQEVKSLAAQTTKAADRITEHVNAIQTTSSGTMTRVNAMAVSVNQIKRYSDHMLKTIAMKIAANDKILVSANTAIINAHDAAPSLRALSSAVIESETAAQDMLQTAESVTTQTRGLRDSVDRFLMTIAYD